MSLHIPSNNKALSESAGEHLEVVYWLLEEITAYIQICIHHSQEILIPNDV